MGPFLCPDQKNVKETVLYLFIKILWQVKVKLSVYLTKHYAMKAYTELDA
jgi:hypothetical protein